KRILFHRPSSARRGWRLGLWCSHLIPLTFSHCYAIFAHKLCCFASRDRQTRWHNLFPFRFLVRKLQVLCQQEGKGVFALIHIVYIANGEVEGGVRLVFREQAI